jgi:hypothetical protein
LHAAAQSYALDFSIITSQHLRNEADPQYISVFELAAQIAKKEFRIVENSGDMRGWRAWICHGGPQPPPGVSMRTRSLRRKRVPQDRVRLLDVNPSTSSGQALG